MSSTSAKTNASEPPRGRERLLRGARFEIVPTPNAVEFASVLAKGTTVHVMCPPLKGAQSGSVILEGHLEGVDSAVEVAVGLAEIGYRAVPHIAAKTVRSREHLVDVLDRLSAAGIYDAFFPGGDGTYPTGPYSSSVELLEELASLDHHLNEIGVAAYPEGHREIPTDVLFKALMRKQRIATFMVSEICFDPAHILRWLSGLRRSGITLPLVVGVPGAVGMMKLAEQLKHWGVGSAVRFLRKQHGMMGAVLRGKYSPDAIVEGIDSHADDEGLGLAAIQFITLNDVAPTERWRVRALDAAATRRHTGPPSDAS